MPLKNLFLLIQRCTKLRDAELLQFVGETPNRSNHLLSTVLDFHNHRAGLVGQCQAMIGLLTATEHLSHSSLGKRLILLHYGDDFFGGFAGSTSQLTHLIGYHGETASMLTRTGGFNGSIECQQVGLGSNATNGLND